MRVPDAFYAVAVVLLVAALALATARAWGAVGLGTLALAAGLLSACALLSGVVAEMLPSRRTGP